jgi:hypothetical protein
MGRDGPQDAQCQVRVRLRFTQNFQDSAFQHKAKLGLGIDPARHIDTAFHLKFILS